MMNPYREQVQNMKTLDAVEYLLLVIDRLIEDTQDHAGVPLTKRQKMIFGLLWKRRGHAVSKDAIYDCCYGGVAMAKLPEPKVIDVLVFQLRQRLEPTGWRIVTRRDFGYMLEKKSDDFS